MRQILTILFLAIVFSSSAQNWQMFPLDSLRCYINPSQDSVYLQGVDYRHYEKFGDTTVIDLGWFARPDTIGEVGSEPLVQQIKTQNSNFGRRVLITDSLTQVIFVNSFFGDIRQDTMVFLNNPSIDEVWTIVESDSFLITGELVSTLVIDDDSVRILSMKKYNRDHRLNARFQILIRKNYGLYSCPIFLEVLSNKYEAVDEVEIERYYEMTGKVLYRVWPNTEVHYKMSDHGKSLTYRLLHKEYKDGKYYGSYTGTGSRSFYNMYGYYTHSEPMHLEYDHGVLPRDMQYDHDSVNIANPIPGKFIERPNDVEFGKLVRKQCDRFVLRNRGLRYYWHINLDTQQWVEEAILPERKVAPDYTWTWLEGVGLILESSWGSGPRGYFHYVDWKYIKFPDGCEMAEDDWRLTSVKEQEQSYGYIFPNPSTDVLHLSADIEVLRATVIDMNGRQTDVILEDNTIQISSLSNGMYVLQFETATGVINYRFIKR